MPTLLFKLRNVPDDEAEAVRQLLREAGIDYYETGAGAWGISVPAVWLPDGEDVVRARMLVNRYENNRAREERARYESLRLEGRHRTFLDIVRENPARVVLYVLFSLFLVYVMIMPFFELID
jgi:hypothetical protein